MTWRELEAGAPEIARLGRERLEATGVALLGTVRADGSPRISPIEPFIAAGELLFGAMARSAKARDLRRDPRCVLHSAVADPDGGEGELKLYGRAQPAGDDARGSPPGAWWLAAPREAADVYRLEVEEALFVSWDAAGAEGTIRDWRPERGYRARTRPYP